MATRFYFPAEGSGAPSLSPSFDAGWEQNGQGTRLNLVRKSQTTFESALANTGTRTVPITTTQDILLNQFVSTAIPVQTIAGTVSLVIGCLESAATANVTLAVVVKVVDSGGAARGTLFSVFGTDTELATTRRTRIVSAGAISSLTTQAGDCLVVELGCHAAAPTAGTTYTFRQGYSGTQADFALTTALSTDLNPWVEFSQDLWPVLPNNYQGAKGGDGLSFGERIR